MMRSLWQRVDPSRLRSLAVAAAVVGLLAGIVGATFASIAGEPAVDDAIAIEEANAAAQPEDPAAHDDDEASVSRSDQRGVGLFGAYALSGAAFGALLALTAHGLRRGRPDPARRVVLAGVILAGAFTVAPWFKYPPNPPAVGDPGTLAERQGLYVAVICIAAAAGSGRHGPRPAAAGRGVARAPPLARGGRRRGRADALGLRPSAAGARRGVGARDAGLALPGRLPGGQPDALGDADPGLGLARGGGATQAGVG